MVPQRAAGRWQSDDRAVVILLGAFVVAWTMFHTIVFVPIGLHPDLTEVYSWGRHPAFGYFKHPPLSGWICGLWFSVFPSADWAFYLLAMVNAAAGLWFVDLIAQRYVSAGKRPIVILLLLMTPFFQFFGLKFNANAVLLSTWPLAVYCFLRAFESRALVWSAAAGAAAALAMLGKYYSIFLIAGIVIAALSHPKAARYLKSPSPWISAGIGLLLVAPHVEWLLRTGWQPLAYAYAAHPEAAFIPVAVGVAGYLAGAVAYVALPIAAYWAMVRPTWPRLVETLWPRDPDRRMLVIVLGTFVLLPALAAPFLRLELTSLWTMQSWFLLPVVLLAPPDATPTRRAALGTAAALAIFTIVAVVVAAPVLSWLNFSRPDKDDRGYAKSLAENVTRLWHNEIGRRLPLVIGDNSLAGSVEFYSADHPDSVPFFDPKLAPWVTPQRMESEGWAAVCNAADAGCLTQTQSLAAFNSRVVRRTIEITPRYLGYSAKPGRFIVTIVPPRALASLTAASPGRPWNHP